MVSRYANMLVGLSDVIGLYSNNRLVKKTLWVHAPHNAILRSVGTIRL